MSRNFKWYVTPSMDGFDKVMSKEFKNYLIKNSMKDIYIIQVPMSGELVTPEYFLTRAGAVEALNKRFPDDVDFFEINKLTHG